jgi:hypothetical protein
MTKDIPTILRLFGIDCTSVEFSMLINSADLVRVHIDGYFNEEMLVESVAHLYRLDQASKNDQCKDLLDQINMILELSR